MSRQGDCPTIFAVRGGIFGVGRLATRLNALADCHRIGTWHIGPWVDWRHTAIQINFGTAADAALAKSTCAEPEAA